MNYATITNKELITMLTTFPSEGSYIVIQTNPFISDSDTFKIYYNTNLNGWYNEEIKLLIEKPEKDASTIRMSCDLPDFPLYQIVIQDFYAAQSPTLEVNKLRKQVEDLKYFDVLVKKFIDTDAEMIIFENDGDDLILRNANQIVAAINEAMDNSANFDGDASAIYNNINNYYIDTRYVNDNGSYVSIPLYPKAINGGSFFVNPDYNISIEFVFNENDYFVYPYFEDKEITFDIVGKNLEVWGVYIKVPSDIYINEVAKSGSGMSGEITSDGYFTINI